MTRPGVALVGALLPLLVGTPIGAQETPAPAPGDAAIEETAKRLGLAPTPGAPMTIEAEHLEATRDKEGRERVVFEDDVRVRQGGLRLGCDWLEALYPHGAGGTPERILARGSVRIRQEDTEVRCTEAVFTGDACSVRCTSDTGPAVLQRGKSLIEGDEIFLDLCSGVLKVQNGRVRVRGSQERPAPGAAPSPGAAPDAAPAQEAGQ